MSSTLPAAAARTATPLPPGSRIGILGGGQLGRMTALAAARLGYGCHIYCTSADEPALLVAAAGTVAPYDDPAALAVFADAVQVVTCEFENVPAAAVKTLAAKVPARPGWKVLRIAQDRAREKGFLSGIGAPTAAFREVASRDELTRALGELGRPAVLKRAMLGYDGKGQVMITAATALEAAWEAMGSARGVLEAFVDFSAEISVIVARGLDGAIAAYDPVENRHVNHILDTTTAPARLDERLRQDADLLARRIAEALDLVGLLAVEMFVTRDGRLLVNELAPRPHNSGHWTIDACATSQFEQLVRAVCGLPLGSTERHSDAIMTNLIGHAADAWLELLAEPGARLHLYGKAQARPGRKMGHVTRLYRKTDDG